MKKEFDRKDILKEIITTMNLNIENKKNVEELYDEIKGNLKAVQMCCKGFINLYTNRNAKKIKIYKSYLSLANKMLNAINRWYKEENN